jgi:hypothetical protein
LDEPAPPNAPQQTHLVSRSRYVGSLLERGGIYSFAFVVGCSAVALLLLALAMFLFGIFPIIDTFDKGERVLMLGLGAFSSVLCVGATRFALALQKAARQLPPVAPITRHNTGKLPEVETLVRGSERPVSSAQTELLRATYQEANTPSEQLLRAAQHNSQEPDSRES